MTDTPKRRPFFDWTFVLIATISLVAAVVVFRRDGMSAVQDILAEDLWLFATILPKVAAGCLIGALARLLIPREMIVRWVGAGSGLRGLVVATIVGALFPGGPFTIFPLAAGFMLSGADRGAAIAFITAWLLIGINRAIIWELPFMGADVVILRNLLSLPLPVLAGMLARIVGRLTDPKEAAT
jgi:uncharacterized membrane protein YraQ (UPF0718 family)